MRVICSWRLGHLLRRGLSSVDDGDEEGKMEMTSGLSFRFVRWRQVGLLQGIVVVAMMEPRYTYGDISKLPLPCTAKTKDLGLRNNVGQTLLDQQAR